VFVVTDVVDVLLVALGPVGVDGRLDVVGRRSAGAAGDVGVACDAGAADPQPTSSVSTTKAVTTRSGTRTDASMADGTVRGGVATDPRAVGRVSETGAMSRADRRAAAAARTRSQQAGHSYLKASVAGALNTANAKSPLLKGGRVGPLCFFPGWLTSELPLHTIAWQAVGTLAYVRKGALRTPKGWAGLGLSVASWAALAGIYKQALGSGAVYDEALREGLGDELDQGSDPQAPIEHVVIDRRVIAAGPVTRLNKRWVTNANVSYGEFSRRNLLNIWRRPDLAPDAKAPVLLQVHGGAWIIGNKDQQGMPLMAHMAERGWVCVAINYRLSPRATWPDHIVDVKRAIAWVKEHIAEYGGDPDFVAITGGSAGGHLSSLAALTPNEPMFQPGFEEADTSLVAAVPFYGVYDWTNRDGTGMAEMEDMLRLLITKVSRREAPEVWDAASSMSWISPSAPPFMVAHGTNDSLVPVGQARSFVAMLRAASKNPVVYTELPGAQHAFEIFNSPRTINTVFAVHRFLTAVREKAGHETRAEAAS
jgi:acetyl esterase/lipase